MLEEDQKTNRMIEALRLFDWVANNQYFFNEETRTGSALILFLNKRDLLKKKLETQPFQFEFTSMKVVCDDGYYHTFDGCQISSK